jgi:secreted PhoX family phosphatase
VWQYTPHGNSGGTLELIFESTDPQVLDAPDNICVSPRGGLVLCEDGDDDQYVRGLTTKGDIFDIARNLIYTIGDNDEDQEANEFAGACFSPDGQTLFVNVQTPGTTFAIWGPWEAGAL